jgi:hypothetical protein
LSVNPWSFAKQSQLPKWLDISIGYGADGMFGGYDNIWTDKDGKVYDRRDIIRYRQFYLSPDINFSRITIKGKTPKVLKLLSGLRIKIPLPTLEVNTKGQVKFHPLYF